MAIKIYKSNRAARKKMSIVDRSDLHAGRPHKKLTKAKVSTSGRGSQGKITVRHRGGGAKRLQRLLDFGQSKSGIPAKVERLEFDPNRSAVIALLLYADGERRYVLAWDGAKVGDQVVAQADAPEKPGNRMELQNVTPGLEVFNIEIKPGRGGKMVRSAGASAVMMDVQEEFAQIKLSSGEVRLIPKAAYATLGKVGNGDHRLQRIGSAGRARRLGRRPQVRGKAMNPVDHPHGGGEGNQPIGMPGPKTPWGKPALGVKTRKKNKYSDPYILSRRPKKGKKR